MHPPLLFSDPCLLPDELLHNLQLTAGLYSTLYLRPRRFQTERGGVSVSYLNCHRFEIVPPSKVDVRGSFFFFLFLFLLLPSSQNIGQKAHSLKRSPRAPGGFEADVQVPVTSTGHPTSPCRKVEAFFFSPLPGWKPTQELGCRDHKRAR